jgi:hypothetical protein
MIEAKDCEYHPVNQEDPSWTETTALIFSVPEAGILGNAYVLARPNLGVAISSVIVAQGFCRQPFEIDFVDPQMHLEAPADFTKYQLANGLRVEVTSPPANYNFQYEHALGGCSFNLDFKALMHPFDVHDPKENPLLTQKVSEQIEQKRGDTWATGHFDLKGRITGELELRGKTYKVDCVDGMDHSWGPRSEASPLANSWIHISFGESFGIHLAMDMDIRNGGSIYENLRFGYVLDHGEVYGITQASIEAEHMEMLPMRNHVKIKDVRGIEHEFFGTAIAAHPWYNYNPCRVSYQSLFRYEHPLHGTGYGEAADLYGMEYLGRNLSKHGRGVGI